MTAKVGYVPLIEKFLLSTAKFVHTKQTTYHTFHSKKRLKIAFVIWFHKHIP